MNKIRYGIFLLLLAQVVQAQPQTVNEVDQKYNSIMRDLRLIKKCYINRPSKCNAKEQTEAQAALIGVSKKVGVLVALVSGGFLVHYAYRKAMRTAPGTLETPAEHYSKEQVIKKRGQEGLTKQSAKGAQGL